MASVGGIDCTFVKGEAPSKKQRLQIWQVPGIHGYGAQALGLGDSEAEFTAILYSTSSGVATWVSLLEAKQGSVITVINDWGTSYTNFLITKIEQPKREIALHSGGARGELIIHGVSI